MLDTNTARLDVAEVLRASRNGGALRWCGLPITLDFDAEREVLTLDGRIAVALVRVIVPLPTGRTVRGPVLAMCPRRCGRRARVLWAHTRDGSLSVACRACAMVTYATASTRCEAERAMIAYDRLRMRLGLAKPWQTFERAPYQRRATHARLAARLDDARRRLEAATRAA